MMMDEKIEKLTEEIQRNPKSPDAYFNRGVAYGQKGESNKAITDFDKSIELDPQDSAAYIERGIAYGKKGELDKAIADFDKAIELNPQNSDAHLNRGVAYAQKGELDNSIADYDKAIELNPQIPCVYLYLGLSYAEKGELDNAIANFDKAIELDSEYMYAYHARGIAYFGKKEWDEAIADFNKAIKLNSNNSGAYSNRGRAYLMKGCYEKSFEDFVRADELEPTLKFTYIHIYVASRINDATGSIVSNKDLEIIENYFGLLNLISEIQNILFYKPQEPEVAHYTSLDTLKTLVNKTPFRLYNSTYMNDPEEGHIFFDVMKKLSEGSGIDLKNMFYGEDDEMSYRSPAYIGSFVELDGSKKKDKLFLWRTYGKHNSEDAAGGCLIFLRESFAETHLPQIGTMSQVDESIKLTYEQNRKPPIYKIIYGENKALTEENNRIPQDIKGELLKLVPYLKKINRLIKENIKQNDAKNTLKQLTRELLDGIRFLFKSSDYREEQEVRVIQFHYHDESQEKESDDIKADMEQIPPRFYLEAPKDFRCNEVILGPMARNLQDWKWWIEKRNPDLKVSKSEIKYENYNS